MRKGYLATCPICVGRSLSPKELNASRKPSTVIAACRCPQCLIGFVKFWSDLQEDLQDELLKLSEIKKRNARW